MFFSDLLSMLLFFKMFLFYLLLAALGLRCCAQAFSSCGERGLLFVAVRRLLIAVASRRRSQALGAVHFVLIDALKCIRSYLSLLTQEKLLW